MNISFCKKGNKMEENYILSTYDNTIMNTVEETNDNTQSTPNNVLDVHYDNQYIDMLSDIIIRSEREIFGHLVEEFNKFYSGNKYKNIKKKFLYDNYELKIEGWIDYTKSGTYINISYAIPSDDGVKRGYRPKYNHIVFTVHPTIKETSTYSTKNNYYIINRIHFNFMDDLNFWPPMNNEISKKGKYLHKNTLPLIIYDDGRLGVRSTNCEELNICLKHDGKIKLRIMHTLCSTITKLIGVKGANLGSLAYNEMRNYNIPNNIERINFSKMTNSEFRHNIKQLYFSEMPSNKNTNKTNRNNIYKKNVTLENIDDMSYVNNRIVKSGLLINNDDINPNNPATKPIKVNGPNKFGFYTDKNKPPSGEEKYYIKMNKKPKGVAESPNYFRYVGKHYPKHMGKNCYNGPFYGPFDEGQFNVGYYMDKKGFFCYKNRKGDYYWINTIEKHGGIYYGPIELDYPLYIFVNKNDGIFSYNYFIKQKGKNYYNIIELEEGKHYFKDIYNDVYFQCIETQKTIEEKKPFITYQILTGEYYSYRTGESNIPENVNHYTSINKKGYFYNNNYNNDYGNNFYSWNCTGGTKNKKNNVDFKTYTVVELKHMCKYYNIKNYSKLNKLDLIKILKKNLKTIL